MAAAFGSSILRARLTSRFPYQLAANNFGWSDRDIRWIGSGPEWIFRHLDLDLYRRSDPGAEHLQFAAVSDDFRIERHLRSMQAGVCRNYYFNVQGVGSDSNHTTHLAGAELHILSAS